MHENNYLIMRFKVSDNRKNYTNIIISEIKYLPNSSYRPRFILFFANFKLFFIYYKDIFSNIIIKD